MKTHNGGGPGGDFVSAATPTKAKADVLGVTPDVIHKFKEETTINFISSPLHFNPDAAFYNPDFNTIIENYERVIKEKNELIEKLLKQKQ